MFCKDTDPGKGDVAATFCQHLPTVPAPTTNIAVTRSSNVSKTLWVSRGAVSRVVPDADMDAFCASRTINNQTFDYWNVRCDP